jgi:putative nucleotidyltransferase with HDIG domain
MIMNNPTFHKEGRGLSKGMVFEEDSVTEIKKMEKKLLDSRTAFFNMLRDLDFSYKELKKLYESLVVAFINALDAKSPWTKGHSERVTSYAVAIAREMSLSWKDIETLRTAALLHDIGKIGTYEVILDKPQSLSIEELVLVQMHPVKGEEILSPIGQLKDVLPIIRGHHERIDGKGYPDGLKNNEIPLLSRIIAVADSFDSMVSERPYRQKVSIEDAFTELRRCSGTQFDPRAVDAFSRASVKYVLF